MVKNKIIVIIDAIIGFKNRFGEKVFLAENAQVQWRLLRINNGNRLRVGKDSIVGSSIVFEADEGNVSIGERTFVGRSHLVCHSNIIIGDDVLISWGVTIVDHNSHSIAWPGRTNDVLNWKDGIKDWSVVNRAPVIIENKVWVGFNAIILKGVTIGEGSIVGAGSVVTKDVPPYTIVAGNPARIIRELTEDECR